MCGTCVHVWYVHVRVCVRCVHMRCVRVRVHASVRCVRVNVLVRCVYVRSHVRCVPEKCVHRACACASLVIQGSPPLIARPE